MNNSDLKPARVDATNLPDGFTTTDPKGSNSQSENDVQVQQRQAEKEAILQQALTPDALERLRRIKVRHFHSILSNFWLYKQAMVK
jgi:Double-stranded DNA-binding domain